MKSSKILTRFGTLSKEITKLLTCTHQSIWGLLVYLKDKKWQWKNCRKLFHQLYPPHSKTEHKRQGANTKTPDFNTYFLCYFATTYIMQWDARQKNMTSHLHSSHIKVPWFMKHPHIESILNIIYCLSLRTPEHIPVFQNKIYHWNTSPLPPSWKHNIIFQFTKEKTGLHWEFTILLSFHGCCSQQGQWKIRKVGISGLTIV